MTKKRSFTEAEQQAASDLSLVGGEHDSEAITGHTEPEDLDIKVVRGESLKILVSFTVEVPNPPSEDDIDTALDDAWYYVRRDTPFEVEDTLKK